jgi:dienelactone hydrolase
MLDASSFAYDQQAPLALTILESRGQDDAVIQDIAYASPRGGKVSAYLIVPSQQPSRAGLIFGHWGQGNRGEFVDEAIVLARLGFVSLCLDAPYRRPAEYEPQQTQPQVEFQWIVDVRRGVDLLLEQYSLTPKQLGYIGHSYSATFGGTLAGIEHRIKVYVLMAGWYALTELARTSAVPVLAEVRNTLSPEVFDAYMTAMAPLDACHYISHAAPSSLFFQFARNDTVVLVEDGQRYFDLASEPKQLAWYDNCGHEFNAQARLDRAIWLCMQLGLSQPSQEVLDALAAIPSPVRLGTEI